jgi:predicted nuclease with TOPRIM domain
MSRTKAIFASAVFWLACASCDGSKEELDKTKAKLQEVTHERDQLKSDLEAANAKVTGLEQQVATLEQAAKTAPPAGAEASDTKTLAKKRPARTTSKRKRR